MGGDKVQDLRSSWGEPGQGRKPQARWKSNDIRVARANCAGGAT